MATDPKIEMMEKLAKAPKRLHPTCTRDHVAELQNVVRDCYRACNDNPRTNGMGTVNLAINLRNAINHLANYCKLGAEHSDRKPELRRAFTMN